MAAAGEPRVARVAYLLITSDRVRVSTADGEEFEIPKIAKAIDRLLESRARAQPIRDD